MTETLAFLLSPRALALGLLLLVLAPGLLLKCLVRAYPYDDPRRVELLAELAAIPRSERPLWVLQQVETALLDGLPTRLRRMRQRRSKRTSLRARLLAPTDAPVMRAGTIAATVFLLHFLLMGVTGGLGLVILLVPFVLLLPALPLCLLVLLAVHRHRRIRRAGARHSS